MTDGAQELLLEAYRAHSVIYVFSGKLDVRANGNWFPKTLLSEILGLRFADYCGEHVQLTESGREEAERIETGSDKT